jgi:hypothetical protein
MTDWAGEAAPRPYGSSRQLNIRLECATTDQQMACVIPNASLEWPSSRPSEVRG